MTEEAKYIADKDLNELNLVRCPKCEGIHFRHAGNVLIHQQYDVTNKRHINSYFVYICIKCGTPWAKIGDEMFEASEHIDVKKFDAVNKALQADTKTDPHC